MATLAGQRAQFTWALRQTTSLRTAKSKPSMRGAWQKYIAAAPTNGFTVEEVTQGQLYPEAEVARYLDETTTDLGPDLSEGQALREVAEAVDVSDVIRLGDGPTVVYAYGYRCAPDRLKIGLTVGDHGSTHSSTNQYGHSGQAGPSARNTDACIAARLEPSNPRDLGVSRHQDCGRWAGVVQGEPRGGGLQSTVSSSRTCSSPKFKLRH